MDPLGTVQAVISAINYLRAIADKVKENKSECKRLCEHAGTLLDAIQSQCKSGVPDDLGHRLSKLANTLLDLSATIEELSQRSLFQRTISRDSVSGGIQKAYRDIVDAVQELHLGLQIDLRKFQQQNEDARRADVDESNQHFERILQNGNDVLQELQVQKIQMQEAMMCLHQYLTNVPQSAERRFLETGMFAMQRRSGPMKQVPDEFVITSFDIIVYHDKKLGEGGFATVYEADWKGSRVAVKQLEKGLPPSAIQQEIDVWKQLKHPHIVEFFGACTIAEPAFIVCALQENGDVINYLREHPDSDRRKLLYDASLGLVYLHHNNVVHGDLKGTNILVNSQGRACLADFGLSRIKVHSTTIRRTKHIAEYGTLQWMSPESMRQGRSNRKTDIYSFGMTMYEVFTGCPPFTTVLAMVLYHNVCDRCERPLRPEEAHIQNIGLDDEMWTIITLCWAQEPQERITASDVAHRLETIVTSSKSVPEAPRMRPSDLPELNDEGVPPPVARRQEIAASRRQQPVTASESVPRALRASSRRELNLNGPPPVNTPPYGLFVGPPLGPPIAYAPLVNTPPRGVFISPPSEDFRGDVTPLFTTSGKNMGRERDHLKHSGDAAIQDSRMDLLFPRQPQSKRPFMTNFLGSLRTFLTPATKTRLSSPTDYTSRIPESELVDDYLPTLSPPPEPMVPPHIPPPSIFPSRTPFEFTVLPPPPVFPSYIPPPPVFPFRTSSTPPEPMVPPHIPPSHILLSRTPSPPFDAVVPPHPPPLPIFPHNSPPPVMVQPHIPSPHFDRIVSSQGVPQPMDHDSPRPRAETRTETSRPSKTLFSYLKRDG